LKKILFFCNLFSISIFANEFINYPFDWTNHFGVISKNGRVIWNDDWKYGILFFDGTFTNYPKRYGLDINKDFTIYNNSSPRYQEPKLDSAYVNTRVQYTQGDYYLDMLSVNSTYADKIRLLTMNGYKKTYTGPYADYSLGIIKPIQQSYFIEYNTTHFQATIGHFLTSSGIPDSSTNGSLNDRIFNASILTKGAIGNWKWTFHGSQFNQKYEVQHSSWDNPSIQHLTRSMIEAKIVNVIKDSISIDFGFSGNLRGLSDIYSFSSTEWGSIYSNIFIRNFNVKGGVSSINNNYNHFLKLLFDLGEEDKGVSFEASRKIKPSYEFMPSNINNSHSVITNYLCLNARYSLSRFNIMTNIFSHKFLQTYNDKLEILGSDINLNFSISDNWTLSGYLRHLKNTNILTDGIGDLIEFSISGNEKLFNNNMILFFDLGFTGWINRNSEISFNPFYCTPILIEDPDFILEDQWNLKSTISLKVSSLKISWKMNNILSALQSKIDSIDEEKTMIINNYLLHQNNRNMGRLMEIHIDWYFSD